jgi:hypothetical protein
MVGQENDFIFPIALSTFDPTTLTGSYQAMNTSSGTSDNVKILKMFNGSSNVGITISFDGINDHDYWPPQATLIIDCEANHYSIAGSGTKYIRAGQVIYGKTTANSGLVFISGFR